MPRFLPGILGGEIVFAIGYTEPKPAPTWRRCGPRPCATATNGSIDGAKVFTSGGDRSDYIWLACRTNPEAAKHRGISILIVPTSSAGFSATPIHTVGSVATTATYYDEVRVPFDSVVGEVDGGWGLITTQLNHERVGLAALGGRTEELFDDVVRWCAETTIDGAARRCSTCPGSGAISPAATPGWRR